ncbi:MAG: sulfur oxidation c-type cytochrome SoxA [Bacillota bacterium]
MTLALLVFPLLAFAAEPTRPIPPRSGSVFQGANVRALEADEFGNPATLWVERGKALWSQPRGEAKASCAQCHGDVKGMRGVAARYPRFDAKLGRVVNLDGRIDACVESRQKAPAMPFESEDRLALTALIAKQSRGLPIEGSIESPATRALWEEGRQLYFTRIGQLNLACTNCHDANWGKTILSETVSQGQPDGWPAYRLEWQTMGSLERRLRACFFGVRAEMPAYGSRDFLALETYLAWRARGLEMSAPAVRK